MSLETSLPLEVKRISPHLPTGNQTRWAAAGSTSLPPVRKVHPVQFLGAVEDAVVGQVTEEAVNYVPFVVNAPPPGKRQTIPTGSALLPNVLNVTRRVVSFRTASTRVHWRSYNACV